VYWDWNEHVSYDAHIDAFASIAESMAKLERVVLEHDLHHGVEVDVGDGRSRSIHGVEAISLLTDVSIRFVSDGSGEKIGEYPSLAVAKLNQSPAWRAAHSEGVVPRPSAVAHLLGGDIVEFSSYRLHRLRGFYDNWLQVLLSLRVEPRLQGERIGLAVVDPPEDASNMLQAYRSNAKEADDLLAPYRDVLRHLGAVTSFRENVENAESLITLLTDEIKGSNENPAFTYQIFEPGAVSRPMSFAGKKLKGVFAPWRIEFSAIDRQLDEENHVLTVEFDYDFESKELNDIRVLNAERLDHNTMNAIFLNREVLLELLSTVDTNFRKNRSGDAMDNARKELLLAAKSHLMSDMRGASSGVKSQTF